MIHVNKDLRAGMWKGGHTQYYDLVILPGLQGTCKRERCRCGGAGPGASCGGPEVL